MFCKLLTERTILLLGTRLEHYFGFLFLFKKLKVV
jgi:hypothetical protein